MHKLSDNMKASFNELEFYNQSLFFGSKWPPAHSEPDSRRYYKLKNVELTSSCSAAQEESFFKLAKPEIEIDCDTLPKSIERIWDQLFARRIGEALKATSLENEPQLLGIFPGNSSTTDRGSTTSDKNCSLQYNRFQIIQKYAQSGLGNCSYNLATSKVNQDIDWVWSNLSPPTLQFIEASYDNCFPPNLSSAEHNESILQNCISALLDQAPEDQNRLEVESIFRIIRNSWSDVEHQEYSETALSLARRISQSCFSKLTSNNLLSFFFELESFANYLSNLPRIGAVASGFYKSSWIDLGYMPINKIRATELCVPDRLLCELTNLTEVGFAPLAINEFDSVADGNHRLTAARIWNILKSCQSIPWELNNSEFRKKIAEYAISNEADLGPVSYFECLHQLGLILQDQEKSSIIENKLRPQLKQYKSIKKLPVIFLPEYCTEAVVKHNYDQTGELLRVPPRLYQELKESPDLILPARASYHFTDRVPLPWIKVLEADD